MALPVVRRFKESRGEAKDKRDVALIDSIHSEPSRLTHWRAEVGYFVRTIPYRGQKAVLDLYASLPPRVRALVKRAILGLRGQRFS